MENSNHHIVAIDSETGFHWDGERTLRHQALVRSAIERALIREDASRDLASCHLAASKPDNATQPA